MIKVSIKFDDKEVYNHILNIDNATRRGIRQGFFQFGKSLVKTASRQVLKKPKGGRTYLIRRGRVKRRHVASAPGESPANLSGSYRRSLGFKIKGSDSMEFGAGNSEVPYAKFLERGTSKMAPRPGLGNAIKSEQKNAQNYFLNNIRKSLLR